MCYLDRFSTTELSGCPLELIQSTHPFYNVTFLGNVQRATPTTTRSPCSNKTRCGYNIRSCLIAPLSTATDASNSSSVFGSLFHA